MIIDPLLKQKQKLKNSINSSSHSIKLIYNYGLKKNNWKKFGLLFIMSFIFAVSVAFNQIFLLNHKTIENKLFIITFISFLSKYILKTEIFSHHKFSIILSLIGLILAKIPILIEIEKEDILVNIYMVFDCFAYSLFLVLIKYLTCSYYISSYLCLLYIGIFNTIISIICFIFYSLYLNGDLSYFTDTFDFSNSKNKSVVYLYIIFALIIFASVQIFTFLIIFYFSPTLFMMSEIIYPIIIWIINNFTDETSIINVIFCSLGYLIVFFAVLVYNEIIICNFWDLNINTTKFIEKRKKKKKKIY